MIRHAQARLRVMVVFVAVASLLMLDGTADPLRPR